MSTDPARPTAPALVLDDVSKRFGGLAAVRSLSLQVPAGSIFGLMGPNGAGKTTVVNLVSGLCAIDTGRISVRGQDVTGQAPHVIAATGVARTYQNVRLFEGLTILENIMAGLYRHRRTDLLAVLTANGRDRRERREAEAQARALMARVGLDEDPSRPAETLSYGVQRRVEIARALASKPSLLLLDEPTAGMNTAESAALGNLLLDLRQEGLTLVVIEHNMQLILNYCDVAAVMNFGELLAQGQPRACIERPEVREAYFGKKADAERIEHLLELRRN